MAKHVIYVNTSDGVGILHSVDSTQSGGKYEVLMAAGGTKRFDTIDRITAGEHADKLAKQKPVATTKPKATKRGVR